MAGQSERNLRSATSKAERQIQERATPSTKTSEVSLKQRSAEDTNGINSSEQVTSMSTDGCNTTNTTVKNVTEAAWKMATTAMCGEDLAKPLLKQLEVLQEMKVAEAAVVEEEIREMLDAAKAVAAGETGDSGKYEKAAETVKKRWELFLAVMQHPADKQPTTGMAEELMGCRNS